MSFESDLYGEFVTPLQVSQEVDDFNSMVHAALETPQGQKLKEYFNEYLKKPIYSYGDTNEMVMYKEGSRRLILDLLLACESAKK